MEDVFFPLVFFDGERQFDAGSVPIRPSLKFHAYQSMLSRLTGMPSNQISSYLVRGKSKLCAEAGDGKIAITEKVDFAAIFREKDCYIYVMPKQSSKERRRSADWSVIVPSGAACFPVPENFYLLQPDLDAVRAPVSSVSAMELQRLNDRAQKFEVEREKYLMRTSNQEVNGISTVEEEKSSPHLDAARAPVSSSSAMEPQKSNAVQKFELLRERYRTRTSNQEVNGISTVEKEDLSPDLDAARAPVSSFSAMELQRLNDRIQKLNFERERYLNRTSNQDVNRISTVEEKDSSPKTEDVKVQVTCMACTEEKEAGDPALFHPCVNDPVVYWFRTKAGPIGRPSPVTK